MPGRLALSSTTIRLTPLQGVLGSLPSSILSDRDGPLEDAVTAIRAALEAAGVEFTNGAQPGVK